MRIGVVGLGAIGGWVAARLAAQGHDVSALARGATLAAVEREGVRLAIGGREERHRLARASDDPKALGVHDLVILAVKGHALAEVAPAVAAMSAPDGIVLTLMNGVPWWFFADDDGRRIKAVDPDGVIGATIPIARVIGGVVHAACATAGPAHIVHHRGEGLILGEPRGGASARLSDLGALLGAAGFEATLSDRIQTDIWYKLWGNMTTNPISALTRATADLILDDELVRAFILRIMAEARETGARIGCAIRETGEDRLAVTRKLGAFKTSMLQDAEAGRPLEIDALLAAPREIAAAAGVETPAMDALLGLARLYARAASPSPITSRSEPS